MLPTDKQERKKHPIWRGVLMYFPRTIIWLSKCSWTGNEQHNPGTELHWERGKSADHEDCMLRHMLEGSTIDDDGIPHAVKAAWRACARAELILEELDTNKSSERHDILWHGERIGYIVGSQALLTCPHCKQVISQNRHKSTCWQCKEDLTSGRNA